MSYDKITILLTGSLRSPPPIRAAPDFPFCRGQNRFHASCRNMAPWLSTHSPTAPRGEGGALRHQRGDTFPTPAGRLYGFIKTGAFYQFIGALQQPSRQRRVKLKPLKNLRPIGPSTLKPQRGLSIKKTPPRRSSAFDFMIFSYFLRPVRVPPRKRCRLRFVRAGSVPCLHP